MTLGNMRELGVQRLIASCLDDARMHQGLVDVLGYPADAEDLTWAGCSNLNRCETLYAAKRVPSRPVAGAWSTSAWRVNKEAPSG